MPHPVALLAAIPSPSSNEIVLGPLHLRAYGLMIALGVIAAVELARRRWRARGHDPDEISGMALWAVPAGLIGARLYHVMTDWQRFEGRWIDAVKVWEGGLGIPGGIALGALAGVLYARHKKMPLGDLADTVAPALPLAQAIGRLGNWFNQELFGGPTSLPWGLEIDVAHRPDRYLATETFHPTFLYEGLWNLALMTLLILIDRKRVLRPGSLFWVYVGGYFTGRLWVEAMRIDPASLIWGVRVNIWMSLVAIVFSVTVVAIRGRRRPEDDAVAEEQDASAADEADETASEVDEPTV
ncbi:MAG: prolipoprotein diacylglyceryl transferase [Acidimicrobiales bacterium]|nr:prolipoprotein diacylglyceryl transferase [Acidimicrobiales bacterium]